MAALKSVMLQLAIIAPLVFYLWSRQTLSKSQGGLNLKQHAVWVGIGSFALETAGLLWSNIRPDYTNALIMAGAYPVVYCVLELLYRSLFAINEAKAETHQTQDWPPEIPDVSYQAGQRVYIPRPDLDVRTTRVEIAIPEPVEQSIDRLEKEESASYWNPISSFISYALCTLITIGALLYLNDYPASLAWVLPVAIVLCLFVWRIPHAGLLLIPAFIPWGDGYVLTGRFLFTELDLLVMVVLAVHYGCRFTISPRQYLPKRIGILLISITLVYALSILWVLFRLTGWGDNPQSFFSIENTMRVAKPWVWFILLIPVLAYHFLNNPKRSTLLVGIGFCFGLAALLFFVLMERWLFTGVWVSADSVHRVRGSFVTMHTGGGHIDAYLVAVLPFLMLPWIAKSKRIWQMLALAGGLVTFYAIFVTYSRGPYAVTAVVMLLYFMLWRIARNQLQVSKNNRTVGVLTAVMALCWLLSPFVIPSFLSDRLTIVDRDTDTRVHQWERVAGFVGPSPISYLVGMGPGMLPRSIMIDSAQSSLPSAFHQWVDDSLGAYLRIQSGRSYYTNQYVHPKQNETYHYRVKYRSPDGDVRFYLGLCEKWIDDSQRCQTEPVVLQQSEDWRDIEGQFTLTAFPAVEDRALATKLRPVTLAFYTNGLQPVFDLNEIAIRDEDNQSLIENGRFERQLDHWYITSDNHLDWHAKNIWINLFFDLGFAGVVAYGVFLLAALMIGFKAIKEGDGWSIPL
jgi:hypothetical protein